MCVVPKILLARFVLVSIRRLGQSLGAEVCYSCFARGHGKCPALAQFAVLASRGGAEGQEGDHTRNRKR